MIPVNTRMKNCLVVEKGPGKAKKAEIKIAKGRQTLPYFSATFKRPEAAFSNKVRSRRIFYLKRNFKHSF